MSVEVSVHQRILNDATRVGITAPIVRELVRRELDKQGVLEAPLVETVKRVREELAARGAPRLNISRMFVVCLEAIEGSPNLVFDELKCGARVSFGKWSKSRVQSIQSSADATRKEKLYRAVTKIVDCGLLAKRVGKWRIGDSYTFEIRRRTKNTCGRPYDWYLTDWNGRQIRSIKELERVIVSGSSV